MVGSAIPGQVGLRCRRKVAEQARGSKPGSSVAPGSLLQLPPRAPVPTSPSDRYHGSLRCNKPFPTQVAF